LQSLSRLLVTFRRAKKTQDSSKFLNNKRGTESCISHSDDDGSQKEPSNPIMQEDGGEEGEQNNQRRRTTRKMTLAMKAKLPEYTDEDRNHGIVLEVDLL